MSSQRNSRSDRPTPEARAITDRLRSLASELQGLAARQTGSTADDTGISEVADRMQHLAARLDEMAGPLDVGASAGSDLEHRRPGKEPAPDPANFGPGDASATPQQVGFDASPEGDHPGH